MRGNIVRMSCGTDRTDKEPVEMSLKSPEVQSVSDQPRSLLGSHSCTMCRSLTGTPGQWKGDVNAFI